MRKMFAILMTTCLLGSVVSCLADGTDSPALAQQNLDRLLKAVQDNDYEAFVQDATPELMAFLDRVGYVAGSEGGALSRKIGGPIAVARRAGHNFTYAQLLMWYMINDMIVPGSSYWNVGLARDPGSIEEDTEALKTSLTRVSSDPSV